MKNSCNISSSKNLAKEERLETSLVEAAITQTCTLLIILAQISSNQENKSFL